MNEQIKELLNKTSAFGPGGDTMDRYNCSLSDLEKFAELIVRELSAVANHFSDGHEVRQFDDSKRYLYFVDIGQVILEHFGVEE